MDEKQLYIQYLEKDAWSEQEVILLLHGLFPESHNRYINFKRLEKLGIDFRVAKQALDEAVFVELLERDIFPQEGLPNVDYNVEDQDYIYRSKDIIEWARGKKNLFPNFPFHRKEGSGISNKGKTRTQWRDEARKKAIELNWPTVGKQVDVAGKIARYLRENEIFDGNGKPVSVASIIRHVLGKDNFTSS